MESGSFNRVASGISGLSFSDTGLTNGAAYRYTVRAVQNGRISVDSNTVSLTPDVEHSLFATTSFSEWRESVASIRAAGSTSSPSASLYNTSFSHEYAALGPNGMIYTVPWGGTQFGKINPFDGTSSLLATAVLNKAYLRPILAPNGKLYVLSIDSTACYSIDPTNDAVTAVTIPAYNGNAGFWGSAIGKNGKIYAVPTSYGALGKILEFDPITETGTYILSAYNSPNYIFTRPVYASDGNLYFVPRVSGRPMQKLSFNGAGVAQVTTVTTSTFNGLALPILDLLGGLLMGFPTNEESLAYESSARISSGDSDWTLLSTLPNPIEGRNICLGPNEKYYWTNGNNKITEYDPRSDVYAEISTGEMSSESDHTGHYDCVVAGNGNIFWAGGYGTSAKVLKLDLHLSRPPSIDAMLYPYWR